MKTAKEILIEKWYPILGDGTENNLDELLEENSELGKMARNLLEAMEEYANQSRNLLKKYIEHVGNCEGTDFIGWGISGTKFTEQEYKELERLSDEVFKQKP